MGYRTPPAGVARLRAPVARAEGERSFRPLAWLTVPSTPDSRISGQRCLRHRGSRISGQRGPRVRTPGYLDKVAFVGGTDGYLDSGFVGSGTHGYLDSGMGSGAPALFLAARPSGSLRAASARPLTDIWTGVAALPSGSSVGSDGSLQFGCQRTIGSAWRPKRFHRTAIVCGACLVIGRRWRKLRAFVSNSAGRPAKRLRPVERDYGHHGAGVTSSSSTHAPCSTPYAKPLARSPTPRPLLKAVSPATLPPCSSTWPACSC